MSSAFMAQLPFIGSSSTLGWQHDDVARSYMEHVLHRARVLLPRRGWRIGLIKEFYPRGATLLGLNVNAGSEVCIRFRVPGKKNEFLPFHEVLCTALHEFTHCVHSRHDRAFWNLYYDLVKECEALEITMIQQGMRLYPAISSTPMSCSGTASQQSCSGREGRTAATASSARGRGRRLGNGGARGGGRGRGGGMSTGSRHVTQTIIKTGRAASSSSSSPTSSAAFPGEGRRLGGGGLRQCDAPIGFTPTRDALRRILADAAERRLARTPPLAATVTLGSHPLALSLHNSTSPQRDEGQSEVDDDDAPDCVPHSLSGHEDGGGWNCPRCGFRNDDNVVGSCAFCADCDDEDEGEATWRKRPRLDSDHSPLETPTIVVSSATASKTVPTQQSQQQQLECTAEEHYIVVSDEDDS